MSSTLYLPNPIRGGNATKSAQHLTNESHDLVVHSNNEEIQTNKSSDISMQPAAATTPRAPNYETRLQIARQYKQNQQLPGKSKVNKFKPFIPRKVEDFDDGGAFPEIPVAQYPRHMGNPHKTNVTSSTSGTVSVSNKLINVQIDESTGKVNYDAVVTGGTNSGKKVYTKHNDIVPLIKNGEMPSADAIALPSEEEAKVTADKTQAALQALISNQIESAKPTGSAIMQANTSKDIEKKTQFIHYEADPNAPGYNPQCKTRVIQMVEAQIDPMMPPKFKHKKVPRGPADDPVPVLHTKPAKLSKEEREAWKVPACISNWKNTRGYTIPLDKRLAADGRNLMEHSINSNFANLAESLYVAERQAREEVNMRAKVRGKLAEQEASKREEELRQLAMQARMERGNVPVTVTAKDTLADDQKDIDRARPSRNAYDTDDANDDNNTQEEVTQKTAWPCNNANVCEWNANDNTNATYEWRTAAVPFNPKRLLDWKMNATFRKRLPSVNTLERVEVEWIRGCTVRKAGLVWTAVLGRMMSTMRIRSLCLRMLPGVFISRPP